jgi:hypothetical protein
VFLPSVFNRAIPCSHYPQAKYLNHKFNLYWNVLIASDVTTSLDKNFRPCSFIHFQLMKLHPWHLTNHHNTQTYRAVVVHLHAFITLALDVAEWLTSCPGCFTAAERTLVPTG